MIRTLVVDREALAAAAGAHFTGASDLAEELVLRCGLDYRSAYRVVGRAVAEALESDRESLTPVDLARAARELLGRVVGVEASTVACALDPSRVIATRTALGGASPQRVREHCADLRERVDVAWRWNEGQVTAAGEAEERLVANARRLAGTASPGPVRAVCG